MIYFNASWAPPGESPALLSAERSSLDGTPLSCVAYGTLSPCSPMRLSYDCSQECCFYCSFSVPMYYCKRTTVKRSDIGGYFLTYPSSSFGYHRPRHRAQMDGDDVHRRSQFSRGRLGFFPAHALGLGTTYWSLSISQNILVTTLICARLFHARHMIIGTLGSEHGRLYTRICAILVESCVVLYLGHCLDRLHNACERRSKSFL